MTVRTVICDFITNIKTEHLSLAVTSLGVFAAYIAVYRWYVEQRWRRKEALFSFLDSFLDTPGAHNATMMLNSREREVPLWSKSAPEDRYTKVSWDDIAAAFTFDNSGALSSAPKHTAIRDCFGDFFGRLNRLQLLREEKLLPVKQVGFVMEGWVKIFARDYREPHMRKIREFLEANSYSKIQALFFEHGLDLKVTDNPHNG